MVFGGVLTIVLVLTILSGLAETIRCHLQS
jgi:hypothetical protein